MINSCWPGLPQQGTSSALMTREIPSDNERCQGKLIMLISNVNGRDKVEICEREEIKSSSSIKAVDKKVFPGNVCAGKTLCQEPSPSEGEGFWAPNTRKTE